MSTSFLPFLYPVRALRRLPRAHAAQQILRSLHATAPMHPRKPRQSDPIPFELPPDLEKELEPDPESAEPEGTITPTERDAFNRIFAEIRHRIEAEEIAAENGAVEGKPEAEEQDQAFPMPLAYRDTEFNPEGRQKVNSIMEMAKRQAHARGKPVLDKTKPRPPTADERLEALQFYPASLREAAKLAMGILEPEGAPLHGVTTVGDKALGDAVSVATEGEPVAVEQREAAAAQKAEGVPSTGEQEAAFAQSSAANAVSQARQRLLVQYQQDMTRKKSDFELWSFMDKNVFSMAAAFQKQAQKAAKGKGPQLSMEINGALYPALLLHGLRLLDGHFERSSPLALLVLPRIKELGLMSYVLGVSASFYNTLMGIYWYRYNDVNAVIGLLDEMQRAGLRFDAASLGVVNSIREHLVPYTLGKRGKFLEDVMKLPEYDSVHAKIAYWRKQIERSIHNR